MRDEVEAALKVALAQLHAALTGRDYEAVHVYRMAVESLHNILRELP